MDVVVNASDSSTDTGAGTNNISFCLGNAQSPLALPFLRIPISNFPTFVSPPQLRTSISSATDHCFRFLHSLAFQNPIISKLLSLSSQFHNSCLQIRCNDYRNRRSVSNHNFAAILPADSVAGLVVTSGVLNFLSLYNTLIIVRLLLTRFPNTPPSIVSPLSNKPLHCTQNAQRVRCDVSPQIWKEGRRMVSVSLVLFPFFLIPNCASAEGGLLDKYVKRKKLDPLEAYIPAVILTQFQIKDLEKTLEGDGPQFSLCRSVLRSGPAASLRINIRAVAQYASDSGNGKTASNDVDECLRSLEELDSLFLRASRNDPKASVKSMKEKISTALNALDSLLQTVPSDVLSKGKIIADSYRDRDDVETESLDPELKQLESIL